MIFKMEKNQDYSFNLLPKDVIDSIPRLGEQESDDDSDAIVYVHFYGQAGDWYITEVDEYGTEAFGYAILSNMPDLQEWGYIWIRELEKMNGRYINEGDSKFMIRRDVGWKPKKFSEIDIKTETRSF